jgi:hypothetical protein
MDARLDPRTDEQLAKLYAEGKLDSHAEGLRRVYDAGRKHDEFVIEQRQAAEDAAVKAEQDRVAAEKAAAEADAARDPAEKKAEAEQAKLEEARAAARIKHDKERADLAEKRRIEDEKATEHRLASVAGPAHKPTKAEDREARDRARGE